MSLLARLRTRHQEHVDFAATPVGHALVLHAPGGIGDVARAVAPALPADVDRDLVVADLPSAATATRSALVAALPRGPRGIRLVFTGTQVGSPADAARWFSARLDRPVVVAAEPLPRGATAVLLVGAGRDGGWAGFPRSADFASVVARSRAPGEPETAEPLPAGVWLRPDGEPRWLAVNRAELTGTVPEVPGTLTLVLGGQHLPPLTLDAVARFWSTLTAADRARARFARYGSVRLPAGHDLGQALADVLGEEVACYNGIPAGDPGAPRVRTVQPNGSLGWDTFAQLFSHLPHEPGAEPAAPRLRGHRAPVDGLDEVTPGVYRWEPDAVVEVVRAGLWVRSPEEPAHAAAVRAAPVDPAAHQLFHDADDRVRELARAVAEQLDVQIRLVNRVVPAPTERAAPESENPADESAPAVPAEVDLPWLAQLIRTDSTPTAPQPPVTAARAGRFARAVGPAPAVAAVAETVVLAHPRRPQPVEDLAPPADPVGEPDDGLIGKILRGVLAPVPAAIHLPEADGERPAEPLDPAADEVWEPVTGHLTEPLTEHAPPDADRVEPVAASEGAETEPVAVPVDTEVESVVFPEGAGIGPADLEHAGIEPVASPAGAGIEMAAAEAEPVVQPEGADVEPGGERAWVRATWAAEFAAAESTASVLARHPKLTDPAAPEDALTDAVSLRLYLAGGADDLDPALRDASGAPVLRLGRCAASAAARLPVHRGGTVTTLSPTPAQWESYREREVVVEPGFLHLLAAPCAAQRGEVDLLVWSMTGRRTAPLEPAEDAVTDRVLFLPGTRFKVLDLSEPAAGERGRIVLRELSPAEVDADGGAESNRSSLDRFAHTSLERAVDRWARQEPRERVPAAAADRFRLLPGLS
ncbi:hypothetical protein UO65_4128 [Actinokineospora spheciospongiae]|uniref:Uncharacterized protein n=1 Tax=Actinokineospora spheciospongiae TaxID=909613 RepID=W7IVY5_9PSEU|nr:hypothetical protein [Actinokineospora spheciospongiae]EWC60581.1 hypothetical protein UO65_4128 [Actinokineospora spheciospongiae]